MNNSNITKEIITTKNAPSAIGVYSQAIKVSGGNTVYISGQIPLVPETMEVVAGGIEAQINQVLKNVQAVCSASGGDLANIVKINVFLTDLGHFALVNEAMAEFFVQPYPARAAIEISKLPKDVLVEMDAVAVV